MKKLLTAMLLLGIAAAGPSLATGLATCDSGPEENWQSPDVLEERLVEKGWEVRRIKVDGGCYEVYAIDENGQRVEVYFHPVTLEPVPIEE
ncbi:MAG TPA: PepSY domain-containing protein [Woeseiaceae bacterium]|nr:PepSY domain-containing protein [Woeseiaceae bacterium]